MEQVLRSKASAMGDPLQVASLNHSASTLFKQLVGAGDGYRSGDTCYAQDSDELIQAVEVRG